MLLRYELYIELIKAETGQDSTPICDHNFFAICRNEAAYFGGFHPRRVRRVSLFGGKLDDSGSKSSLAASSDKNFIFPDPSSDQLVSGWKGQK